MKEDRNSPIRTNAFNASASCLSSNRGPQSHTKLRQTFPYCYEVRKPRSRCMAVHALHRKSSATSLKGSDGKQENSLELGELHIPSTKDGFGALEVRPSQASPVNLFLPTNALESSSNLTQHLFYLPCWAPHQAMLPPRIAVHKKKQPKGRRGDGFF